MKTIQEARIEAAKTLGLSRSFDGTAAAYRNLSQADQIRLTNEVYNIIDRNPALFTAEQVKLARNVIARGGNRGDVVDTSFDWAMFGQEVITNAREINPLDPQNIKQVGYSILAAGVILGAFYIWLKNRE